MALSLGNNNTVLKRSFVERIGREFGQARMHAILNLQSERPNAQEDGTLEQRIRQACFGCAFVDNHRTKLAMIAHQNELLRSKNAWNQRLWLGCLRRFVNEDKLKFAIPQARVCSTGTGATHDFSLVENSHLSLAQQPSELAEICLRQFAILRRLFSRKSLEQSQTIAISLLLALLAPSFLATLARSAVLPAGSICIRSGTLRSLDPNQCLGHWLQ